MSANDILSDQVIHVKRGRQNGFGFEPLWNSYFDFYLEIKYLGEPLLELEDVTFHLYLRKNLNDKNPAWKMPTIRQLRAKFGISYGKIYAMLERLEKAQLLTKESGVKAGSANERNDYILSDPISTLTEFLEVAAEGLFGRELMDAYKPCNENRNTSVTEIVTRVSEIVTPGITEIVTPRVTKIVTDQQTLNPKQTLEEQVDPAFAELRVSVGEKTFDRFMDGAKLVRIEEGVAVIGIISAYAKDWIENRMLKKIKYALKVDGVRCVVMTESYYQT